MRWSIARLRAVCVALLVAGLFVLGGCTSVPPSPPQLGPIVGSDDKHACNIEAGYEPLEIQIGTTVTGRGLTVSLKNLDTGEPKLPGLELLIERAPYTSISGILTVEQSHPEYSTEWEERLTDLAVGVPQQLLAMNFVPPRNDAIITSKIGPVTLCLPPLAPTTPLPTPTAVPAPN